MFFMDLTLSKGFSLLKVVAHFRPANKKAQSDGETQSLGSDGLPPEYLSSSLAKEAQVSLISSHHSCHHHSQFHHRKVFWLLLYHGVKYMHLGIAY